MSLGLLKNKYFHLLFIAFLGILAYSNTFNVPFVWDDLHLVFGNKNIRNLSNYSDLSGTRYLTFLSLAVNYKLGGYDVAGYHVFNISVHILNALLLYMLVISLFKTPALSNPGFRFSNPGLISNPPIPPLAKGDEGGFLNEQGFSDKRELIALLSSLIFVTHPVHSQAVNYIVQRSTLLAAFFCLASAVLFIKARLNQNKGFFSKRHLPYYVLSVISMALAMKSKEIAFTMPFMIVLSEYIFFQPTLKLRQAWRKSLLYLLPFLLTLLIIPLDKSQPDVFTPTKGHFGVKGGDVLSAVMDETSLSAISRKDYTLTSMRGVLTYIRLFFMPLNLNLDYDYPVYNSFFNPQVFLSFIFIVLLLGLSVYLFKKRQVLISFGILWFFITLSLESFAVVLNAVIFEYRLYLPSMGILIAVIGAVLQLSKNIRTKTIKMAAVSVFALLPLAFAFDTYTRNYIWQDNVRLWLDAAEKSPRKSRVHINLGIAYHLIGLYDKAIEHFQKALSMEPGDPRIHAGLGAACVSKGLYDKAIAHSQIALRLDPDSFTAYNNLGSAYQAKGLHDRALEYFQKALSIAPDNANIHINLAPVYISKRLYDKAIEESHIALEFNPRAVNAYNNLGIAYKSKGLYDKAIESYYKALKLKPDSPDVYYIYYNLGSLFESKGLYNRAIEHYKKAIELNPSDSGTFLKLISIYRKTGRPEEAKKLINSIKSSSASRNDRK